LASWTEHGPREQFKGRTRRGTRLTLVESVRRDPRRGLTIFHNEFVETRGHRRRSRSFVLTFRTRPLPGMVTRIESAGFRVESLLGDYQGGPWHEGAETWLILARKQ